MVGVSTTGGTNSIKGSQHWGGGLRTTALEEQKQKDIRCLRSPHPVLKARKLLEEPLVLRQQWKPGNTGFVIGEEISGGSSNRENQLINRRAGQGSELITFLLPHLFYLGRYQKVLPTFGMGLLRSIKATRTIPRVKLPTPGIIMCGKLTLKPAVTSPKVATQFWVRQGVSPDLYTLSSKFTGKRNVPFSYPSPKSHGLIGSSWTTYTLMDRSLWPWKYNA